ncbi:MAG: efflux transporter outer membrane subunit [Thermodesulfovibrionales bacterium]
MRRLIFIVLLIILSGCSLTPEYKRPEAPIPKSWPSGPAYIESVGKPGEVQASDIHWRDFFVEERLQKLIALALNNNRDLKLAALNVEMARALYRIQRAELFPAVNASVSGSKQRIPANVMGFPESLTIERYDVNLGISSWELDFFGRIRSLKDAALQKYLSTEQAHRSAVISLIAEVANAYLILAADKENLKLAESTLKTQQAIYDLIRRRYEVGLASELDLRRAQTQVDTAKGDVARYIQIVAQSENALKLLVGTEIPENLLPEDLSTVSTPKEISAGISSEVLLKRPDILAAEYALKSANANIGAARATFFPRISLTGIIGTASEELSGLFKSGSDSWSFAPQMIMPIFDARTWAAYNASKVDREILLTQYEKAIQTAFREVADALAIKGTIDRQLSAQESLVNAVTDTYRLANVRYTKGIDSYLSVLDAQRSLYNAQQGLIALRLSKLTNLVTLYKVLGGV